MKFCRHEPYVTVDDIWEPKYSTDEILIGAHKVPEHIEHVLIKFKKSSKYPSWFYMSAKMIRKHPTQKNGRTTVYVVPMSKREEFEPIKQCEHDLK